MKPKSAFVFVVLVASTTEAAGPPSINSDLERLGMHLYKDRSLSFNATLACQGCHHPQSGFADRRNAANPMLHPTSIGADGVSHGTRNAPTAAYAGYSPALALVDGEWKGGLFWDGRATGHELGDPLADQAKGPPLNPVEMAMPNAEAIVEVVRKSTYAPLWKRVFGRDSLNDTEQAYSLFALAVAAYERSSDVTQFSSRFDLAPGNLSQQELRGLRLVEDHCSQCHTTTAVPGAPRPLFTSFGFANIGLPSNPLVPLDDPDLGLGVVVNDPAQDGKFKIPTLRNITKTPPYGHNGAVASLRDMIALVSDRRNAVPEVPRNLATSTGSLRLTDKEIDDVIAFLSTLEDGAAQ